MKRASAINFANWLQQELDARGWRQAELVRQAKINSGYLSQILKRERIPGWDACRGIAKAFNMRGTEVAKIAGLLDEELEQANLSPIMSNIIRMASELSEEDQKDIEAVVRAIRVRRRGSDQ